MSATWLLLLTKNMSEKLLHSSEKTWKLSRYCHWLLYYSPDHVQKDERHSVRILSVFFTCLHASQPLSTTLGKMSWIVHVASPTSGMYRTCWATSREKPFIYISSVLMPYFVFHLNEACACSCLAILSAFSITPPFISDLIIMISLLDLCINFYITTIDNFHIVVTENPDSFAANSPDRNQVENNLWYNCHIMQCDVIPLIDWSIDNSPKDSTINLHWLIFSHLNKSVPGCIKSIM